MLSIPTIVHRPRAQSIDPPPIQPSDLGLPDKFTEWRDQQWNGVEQIVNSTKRFTVLCCPTGAGKTLISLAAAILLGQRTVMLTATKGLQDQVSGEMNALVADIRGLNNYLCPIADRLGIPRDTSVADAPCQCGYQCAMRRGGCEYYDRYRQAQRASITVTNFQCWMYDGSKDASDRGDLQFGAVPTGLDIEEQELARERQKVGMLVCDEIHDGVDQISMFLGVDLYRSECLSMHLDWPDAGLTVDDWRQWAGEWLTQVDTRVESAEQKIKSSQGKSWSRDLKRLRDLKRKLERLSGMREVDQWILNEQDRQGQSMAGVRFDPLSPARYAEDVLWRNVPKIVLVSATVRPKTCELLGIQSSELEFCEYDSSFDPKRRPTIFVPTVRMDYRTEQDDHAMKWMLTKVDGLIGARLDRKGIIHAVSYKRATFLKENSEFGQFMMIHNSHDRSRIVEEFRRREPPAILVSPSVDTGYDFHGDQCRFQLIIKIPFASVQNRLIKARQEKDKEYGLFLAAQTLVQMTGRAVRCFDLETEILTTDGWKKYNEVRGNDTAYGISSMNGTRQVVRGAVTVKENPIRAVKINEKPEPVIELYCPKGFDIVVTPDHSMVVQVRATRNGRLMSTRGLVKLPARDLPERFKIINAGRLRRKHQSIRKTIANSCTKTQDWFKLMGIIISDGHIHKTKSEITIIQSKPEIVKWIDDLLSKMRLKHRRYTVKKSGTEMSVRGGKKYIRNHDTINWVFAGTDAAYIRDVFHMGHTRRLSVKKKFRRRRHKGTHGYAWVDGWKDVEKTIPRWVLQRASTNQMRAMLEGLMAGDGSLRKGGGTYFTADRELADRLQELLVLSGYKSQISSRRVGPQYEVAYCTKGFTDGVRKINIKRDMTKKEKTWCVSTDLGTIIARRRGKTFITGNSESDWAETIITDSQASWFVYKIRKFLPSWWWEAFTVCDEGLPEPLNFDEPCPHCGEIHIEEGCR